MGLRWRAESKAREAAQGSGRHCFIVPPSGRMDASPGSRFRRQLAWPGAAGQTAASCPRAPAGSGGSGPGRGWGHCVNWSLKTPQCPGFSAPPRSRAEYLHWPGGPVAQGTNGVAFYLLADLPQGVDLSRPGVPPHKAGHHLVHPVHTCSHGRTKRREATTCGGSNYLFRDQSPSYL